MINFAFFLSIFSSCSWLIFIYSYINDKLHGMKFVNLGVIDVLVFTTITIVPVLIIWIIFGHINSYISSKTESKKLNSLIEQVKRGQEYSDLISRALIQNDADIKSGLLVNRFDLYIMELNDIISEIVRQLGTPDQKINDAWTRVSKGEKWAICKILIEIGTKNPKFSKDLVHMIKVDDTLNSPVIKFCTYYKNMLDSFAKHDKDKFFLTILETGALSSVFRYLLPAYNSIKGEDDIVLQIRETPKQAPSKNNIEQENLQVSSDFELNGKPKWVSKILNSKPSKLFENKNEEKESERKDKITYNKTPVIDKDSFYMFAAKTKKEDELKKEIPLTEKNKKAD